MKKNKDNNIFIIKVLKDSIEPSLFIGGIMAIICLIACRDDPLKENILRVCGASLSCYLFMTMPFVFITILGFIGDILKSPFRYFNSKKKTKK